MRATTKGSRKAEKVGREIVATTRTSQTPIVMLRRTTTIVTVIANFIAVTSEWHSTPVTTTGITATKQQPNIHQRESGEKSSLSFFARVENFTFSACRARRVY